MKRLVSGLAAGLLLTQIASAAEFSIDSTGARPRQFRLTAICRGLDNYISPEPYKTSLFDRVGKSIMGYGTGLELGMQGGKTYLTMSVASKPVIVGNADDLDNILPVAGVKLAGYQEWDMLSHAWRLRIDTSGAQLAPFTGTRLDVPIVASRIIAQIKAVGKLESESNVKVLMSILTHHFSGFATNAHTNPTAFFVAQFKAEYADPIAAGLASLSGAQRQQLLDVNEEVLDAANAYMREVNSGQYFTPGERKAVLAEALKLLQGLQGR